MSKEIYISSTPHETRLAIVENDELSEIYYERENEYTLAGSIYNGKVTRVLPGMQSAFVDIGLERDAFLYVTDFMEEQEEGADFDAGDEAAAPRAERGERSERGERGRRGRRQEPRAAATETETLDASAEPAGEEASEDASGSRRWRGRRGRRRGRGQGREREAAPAVEGEEAVSIDAAEFASEESFGDDVVLEGGYAGDDVEASTDTEAQPRPERREDDRGGRGRNDRRDRGRDRGRGRDREDRGGRERRPAYGSYAADDQEDLPGPTGEPVLLPGEKLRKYLSAEEIAAEEAANPKPVVEATAPVIQEFVAEGWDGGLVLPGETIRPRGPVEGAAEEAPRRRDDRGGRERGDRDRRDDRRGGRDRGGRGRGGDKDRDRKPRHEEPVAEQGDAFAQQVEPQVELEESYAVAADVEPVEAAQAEAQQDTGGFPVEVEVAEVKSIAGGEAVLESPASQEIPKFESAPVVAAEEPKDFEPEEGASAGTVTEAPKRGFLRWRERRKAAKEAAAKKAEEERAAAVVAPVSEDFTAVQATGEMISRFPGEDAVLSHQEEPSPASPMEHEKVVQGVGLAQADLTPAPHHYGDGEFEEEFLEDDEFSIDALHAQAADEEDFEVEEETLEGAADFGKHLREISVEGETEEDGDEDELTDDFSDVEEREGEEGGEQASGEGEPRRGRGRSGNRGREDRRDDRRGGRGRMGGGGGRGRGRQRVQAQDLPAINELLKPGQEILVQIAKEPIAKKGARITSHIALPGRFLVFMPTVNHTGVSRKIASDGERRRLKQILLSEKGDATGGFIVRTAAEGASEEELRSDLRFLINLWNDIKSRSEGSKSPALIYHDLNLVERILRDQVTDNFSAIWVDSENDYERILRFLQRFQPSLIRRVKLYTKQTPLFEQFGVTSEIDKALKSKVWLKSGGSIVINQTEALVAIDINTGKYVGKTARLEDTIVKTNLDAIPEIVRQIRLRDLGGIIVIDFIDMDERKNRQKVLQALEEELKNDRAPSKVLQFNDFGLVAITRKRVRQSLERTLSTPCAVCTGTGMVKSPVTVANEIYIEMRKMFRTIEKDDMMLRVHPEVVKQLKANNSRWLHDMEEMTSKTILVKSDPSLSPEQFDIH